MVLATINNSAGEAEEGGSPFRFTGEQLDDNGLLYLRARYYHPGLGVFTALDLVEGALQRPMSLNGYSWVEGNTPNWTDPSGSDPCLQDDICEILLNNPDTPRETLRAMGCLPNCHLNDAIDPIWNTDPTLNNCYSYATNQYGGQFVPSFINQEIDMGQIIAEIGYFKFTCEFLDAALCIDGIQKTYDPTNCRARCSDGWAIYLVATTSMNPNDELGDYHFYRQHSDGSWTSKPGHATSSYVTACDGAENLITDPRYANHDYSITDPGGVTYDESCGFYCVCPSELGSMCSLPDPGPGIRINPGTGKECTVIDELLEAMYNDGLHCITSFEA